MHAVCRRIGICQLVAVSIAAAIPIAPPLTLYNNADVHIVLPSNSTLLLNPYRPDDLGVPAPAAPYTMLQGRVFLEFYDYGAAVPSAPAGELLETAFTRIVTEHVFDSKVKISKEVIYSLELTTGAGTLWFSLEPEPDMTWEMFATAAEGVRKFLRKWDNTEFAVDVDLRMDGGGKVGTAYLSRF